MRTPLVAIALAAGVLAAACSGSSAPPSPSSSAPSASSPAPTPSPTPSPTPAPVLSMRSGGATVKLSGQLKAKLSLPLEASVESVWQPTSGTIALHYLTRDANGLVLQGTLNGRSARTSTELTLLIVVQQKHGSVPISSSQGECRITLTGSNRSHVAGRFACGKLTTVGGKRRKVTASGTFSASH